MEENMEAQVGAEEETTVRATAETATEMPEATVETAVETTPEGGGESSDGAGTVAQIDPEELSALRSVYPEADPQGDMSDPLFRGLLCGEVKPTLRQVYELYHHERLTEAAVGTAVSKAVSAAVSAALAEALPTAVAEAEANLLADIRLRETRPPENGIGSPAVVASHPSVDRLTRAERAALAGRAERGERIRL